MVTVQLSVIKNAIHCLESKYCRNIDEHSSSLVAISTLQCRLLLWIHVEVDDTSKKCVERLYIAVFPCKSDGLIWDLCLYICKEINLQF